MTDAAALCQNIKQVSLLSKDCLDVDGPVTTHELCSELDMGYKTVQQILKDELSMSRVRASWVPRLMKNHEMERQVMNSWIQRHF